jgi:hypothetical protein
LLCTFFAIAAKHGLLVEQTDVNKAYLHGDLNIDHIFVTLPKAITNKIPKLLGKLLHLMKSLYGLPQLGQIWCKTYDGAITKNLGYKSITPNLCVYVRMEKLGNKILHHLMAVYVNNNLHTLILQSKIDHQKSFLKAKFGLKEHSSPKMVLGIQTKKLGDKLWHLLQPTYLNGIIKKFLLNKLS